MSPSPAARIGAAVVLVVGIATLPIDSARRAALVALGVSIVIAIARPAPRWLVRRAFAATFAIFCVTFPLLLIGQTANAIAIGFRALAAALTALAIGSTLSIADVPRALRTLGVPKRLAATIFALAWQLGHLVDEAERLMLARRLRGATGVGPSVMTALLMRSRLRADRVELAMELRGATEKDAVVRQRFSTFDALTVALSLVVVVGLHVFR